MKVWKRAKLRVHPRTGYGECVASSRQVLETTVGRKPRQYAQPRHRAYRGLVWRNDARWFLLDGRPS